MQNYKEVPNIISGKDLDYLSDMFEWNYEAYKKTYNSIDKVTNKEVKDMLNSGAELFKDNVEQILEILGGNYE